jgi:hypothetical protein
VRVSFDLDGTAWKHQAIFIALAKALQRDGHEVGVLTAHSEGLRAADLRLWAARGFPAPDFFYNADDMLKAGVGSLGLRHQKISFAEMVGITCHFDDFDDFHPDEIEFAVITDAGG